MAHPIPVLTSPALLHDGAQFFLVVLPVKDFPLGAAFGDFALLGFNLSAGSRVDGFFLLEPLRQNVKDGKPDGVPIFDELYGINASQPLGDLMGQEIYFFTSKTHVEPLYRTSFRSFTSLFLMSLNIS